jgi:NADH-quinone oxidoreductase subunit L
MTLLWLIPILPLLGATLLGLAGPALGKRASAVIGTASVGFAALIAITIGVQWLQHPPAGEVFTQTLWSWVSLPGFSVKFGLYLDPLALLMTLVITIIGTLIHLYSTEYMQDDPGYSRFFAYLNLFVAAMLLLVLADDLVVLFVGWEGVGVCSYLLVGFWFSDSENGAAAQKSFIVTRIADIAMLAGLLLLSTQLGTLNIQAMLTAATAQWPQGGTLTELAAALLLVGGLGKSAQVPLQTWLPDAMAGPTPVSALIHAATMVTAGVYLVARTHVLFLLAPEVMRAIAIGGALTLLIAALAGLMQSDIKRVLAYSTMSQIGYMFVALGVGAWSAAMFHFLTHAVFKALLFLSAGAISMRLHHEQNIFAMGGLRRKIPAAFWAFLIGAASLAALPLVSAGFFSKEMILGDVWAYPSAALWAAGITGALLTAIYIFRAVFIVFFGPVTTEPSGAYGIRILLPLALLALAALTIGWLETPAFLGGSEIFSRFLTASTGAAGDGAAVHHPIPVMITLAGCTAPLAGIAIAFALHRSGFWLAQANRSPGAVGRLLRSGCGFDAVYDALLVKPYLSLVAALRHDPVDLLSTGLAGAAIAAHRRLRATQTGRLRRYIAWITAGSVATLALLLFA